MKTAFRFLPFAVLGVCLMASPALSKGKAAPAPVQAKAGAQEMLDISAEESLEWYQDTRLYVARGKARAARADMVVEADILTAHARQPQDVETKGSQGAGNIDTMTAEGNVFIHDSKQKVYGQKAVYDLDAKIIKITGSNLKYMTDQDSVTAKDSLEYHEDKNSALARGRAVAEHAGSRIESDLLSAEFIQGVSGQKELKEIRAKGNVIIVTKDGGVSRGENAVYDAKKDRAVLMDHVRITRGETQLAGDKAEIDFASGQSRLLNSGSGRVRALLPSSTSSKEKARE